MLLKCHCCYKGICCWWATLPVKLLSTVQRHVRNCSYRKCCYCRNISIKPLTSSCLFSSTCFLHITTNTITILQQHVEQHHPTITTGLSDSVKKAFQWWIRRNKIRSWKSVPLSNSLTIGQPFTNVLQCARIDKSHQLFKPRVTKFRINTREEWCPIPPVDL